MANTFLVGDEDSRTALAEKTPYSPNQCTLPNRVQSPEAMAIQNQEQKSSKMANLRSVLRYPRGTFFCLGQDFSERFSYYGMKSILMMYLITAHHLPPTTAKLIYHTFVFTVTFMPVFGSILADGFFGRYRVILYGSIVYCCGHILLTVGAVPSLGLEVLKALDYTGLFVIALATGALRPSVYAFAADQFPEHMAAERTQFFSFFYLFINVGALLSQLITPVLRRQSCLGNDTCFPLAFAIPAIAMFLATILFGLGTPFYKITRVHDNVIWRVCKCVGYALKEKIRHKSKELHWWDYAVPKYEKNLVEDIKAMFNVMVLFIPVILFWALFEQQGSTWVLQANQLNGRVGHLTILPDQMGVLNPILTILLIPIFEGLIYPTLAKWNVWTSPLRRMGWGGFFAAFSFIGAGLLQVAIQKTGVPLPPAGHSRVTVVNFRACNATVLDGMGTENFAVGAGDMNHGYLVPNATVFFGDGCQNEKREPISMEAGFGYVVGLFENDAPYFMQYPLQKTPEGKTRVYFLHEAPEAVTNFNLSISVEQNDKVKGSIPFDHPGVQKIDVEPDLIGSNRYEIYVHSCMENCTRLYLRSFEAETGAALVVIIPKWNATNQNRLIEIIQPNGISIMWQIPQLIVLTIGEILFSITGFAFAYSQASPNMKSVFLAIWILTSAFGNLIDMGLSGSGLFENKPELEFFVYGILMGVTMMVFVVLAWRYKHPKRDDGVCSSRL